MRTCIGICWWLNFSVVVVAASKVVGRLFNDKNWFYVVLYYIHLPTTILDGQYFIFLI